MNHFVRLPARSAASVYLVAALAAVCAARPTPVQALDSNDQLADRGFEPWKTCRFFGPNPTAEAKAKYGAVPCYMHFKLNEIRYGFHTGAGHGSSTTRVLDKGLRRHSVDRCALAHDAHYWGADNERWALECMAKVVAETTDEAIALNAIRAGGTAYLGTKPSIELLLPKSYWVDLPKDATDIRAQASACSGTDNSGWKPTGKLIVGLRGFVLDVTGWAPENGAKVGVWQRNGGCNQRWRWIKNTKEIRGLGGKCLETPGAVLPSAGTKVQMWDCNGGVNQQWAWEHGQLRTQNKLCLDINREQTPGDVIVWSCGQGTSGANRANPKQNQQWRLE